MPSRLLRPLFGGALLQRTDKVLGTTAAAAAVAAVSLHPSHLWRTIVTDATKQPPQQRNPMRSGSNGRIRSLLHHTAAENGSARAAGSGLSAGYIFRAPCLLGKVSVMPRIRMRRVSVTAAIHSQPPIVSQPPTDWVKGQD